MDECLFCGIISGKIKADIVYRDDKTVAFRDIAPQAPQHILIVPSGHVDRAENVGDLSVFSDVFRAVKKIVADKKIFKTGDGDYRVVMNSGPSAGQSVFHLHFHLLGGRSFHWPPG